MKEFIKNLFSNRTKDITVIVLDDSKPGQDNSYTFKPNSLFFSGIILFLFGVLLTVGFYFLTPLGGFIYSADEVRAKQQLISISERINALQDSLDRRDSQLRDIKSVIRTNADTLLALNPELSIPTNNGVSRLDAIRFSSQTFDATNQVAVASLVYSDILSSIPDFPSSSPVPGILTKEFNPKEGHFGIDLASKQNQGITNLANGTVIYSNKTLNDGFVISIQHQNGYVTTYKHCERVLRKVGDVVRRGEIIAYVGDIGTSSSGPHLHFEIWKDGVAQNPELYLIL